MALSLRLSLFGTILLLAKVGNGFQVTRPRWSDRGIAASSQSQIIPTQRLLYMVNETQHKYSTEIRLREEAESPFRRVRFFLYASLAAGAATSLVVSAARIAAALGGRVNEELLQESVINTAIDIGGLALIAFLFQQDVDAQESRLKRASKGADLARLKIRGRKSLLGTAEDDSTTFTTSLSALRRGRGIEKRVIIAAAGKDKIDEIMKEARALQDSLCRNDLLVVPVVLPPATAPTVEGELPECMALPVGDEWKSVINDEASEARKQGVDVEKEGISIVLKKNGRVGTRTKGVFLRNMVGEVVARRESGMDVSNI
jgi:Low psii accumulation1 / Rep27